MVNNLAFDHAFKVMGATQQLMVRSLINLIEMISTSSHRYAQDNSAFTDEAMSLMKKATATREPESLRDLQKEWAQTCMKFSQSQTRATMGFVEQFGQQVLGTIANNPFTPAANASEPVTPVKAAAKAAPQTQTPPEGRPSPKPQPKAQPKTSAPKTPVAKKAPALKTAAPKTPKPITPASKATASKTVAPKTKAVKAAPAKTAKPEPVAKPATAKPASKTIRKNSTTAEKS